MRRSGGRPTGRGHVLSRTVKRCQCGACGVCHYFDGGKMLSGQYRISFVAKDYAAMMRAGKRDL